MRSILIAEQPTIADEVRFFAQAIREGSKKRPQGFREYFLYSPMDDCVHSCALGAAFEHLSGITIQEHEPIGNDERVRLYPELDLSMKDSLNRMAGIVIDGTYLPEQRMGRVSLVGLVAWTNDRLKYTREAIADMLDRLAGHFHYDHYVNKCDYCDVTDVVDNGSVVKNE